LGGVLEYGVETVATDSVDIHATKEKAGNTSNDDGNFVSVANASYFDCLVQASGVELAQTVPNLNRIQRFSRLLFEFAGEWPQGAFANPFKVD
jgi:hypothetical protein